MLHIWVRGYSTGIIIYLCCIIWEIYIIGHWPIMPLKGSAYIQFWIMNLRRMETRSVGWTFGCQNLMELGIWYQIQKTSKWLNLGFSWFNLKSEIRDLYDILETEYELVYAFRQMCLSEQLNVGPLQYRKRC